MITVHEIDIFIPTRRRALIASASLPCRVHLPASIPTLEVLDDKYLFAAEFAGEEHHLPTHLAQGSEDLERLRSEEHTSELQSLMRISYAVFCLKKQNKQIST